MSTDTRSLEELATEALHEYARSQATLFAKRGALLTRFAQGHVSTAAFAGESFKLALEETARYAQDVLRLGESYIGFVSGLARAAAVTDAAGSDRHARASGQTKNRRRARSGRGAKRVKSARIH
jgi:hypothetical protein